MADGRGVTRYGRVRIGLVATALAGCAPLSVPPPSFPPPSGPVAIGNGQDTAALAGLDGPLVVFTFRPAGCAVTGVLLVFHGVDRDAGLYRDAAAPLGQRYCLLVVAPLFDAARFPSWRYQRGGLAHDGVVRPVADWTVALAPRLASWARAREGRADLPYALLAHSAGAQFISRVAAYGDGAADRIVIANPSTWVRPSIDAAAPYGFGGLFDPAEGTAALRRYLGLPITVLLGQDDVGRRNIAHSAEADAQGATRLQRGVNVFHEAEAAARAHGWAFGWRLAVVPGVGHDARRMFASDAAVAALRPGAGDRPP